MEKFQKILEFLPFFLGTGPRVHFNKLRAIEAVISAGLVVGVLYGAFNADIQNIKQAIGEIKTDLRTMSHRVDNLNDKK